MIVVVDAWPNLAFPSPCCPSASPPADWWEELVQAFVVVGTEERLAIRKGLEKYFDTFGNSIPLSLRLMSLQAMENSLMSIFPSPFMSASPQI